MIVLSILTAVIVLTLVGVTVYLLAHIGELTADEAHRRAAKRDVKIPCPRLPNHPRNRDYAEKYFTKRVRREP